MALLYEPGVFTVLLFPLREELLILLLTMVSFNESSLEAHKDIFVLTWFIGDECDCRLALAVSLYTDHGFS